MVFLGEDNLGSVAVETAPQNMESLRDLVGVRDGFIPLRVGESQKFNFLDGVFRGRLFGDYWYW